MKLSAPVLLCPRVHCSRMQTRVSVRGLPPVTFHLWLLFLSSSLQPSLSALVFSKRPEHGVGVLGSPLTLPCVAYDSVQQRGVSVHWERAGGGPALEGHYLTANGSLFWPRLREQDLGRYFCKASAGTDHIMAAVQVELADLGPVFHSPQSVWVSEGEPVSLQCVSGDSAPPARITWFRDGASLTRGKQIQGQYGGGSQSKTSGTLHLSNVSVEDQGEYVCVTHNAVLNISRNSHAAMLTVLGAPRRLQIIHGPDNVTVAVGTEASMSCVVRGFPVPTVMWFKDGRPVVNSSSFSMLAHGQRLVFRNVSEEQEGSYHCEAQNEGETARSQPAFLLPAGVSNPGPEGRCPEVMDQDFVQQPSDHTARRGDSLTLVCRPPRSRPPARLAWLKNNAPLPPGPHYTLAPHGDLTFHSVQETDSGTYLCRASNPYLQRSVTSRSISLKVLAPPTVRLAPLVATVPVGAQVVFQCQVWGHPAPSIRWHKQGLHWETGGRTTVGVRNSSLFIQSVRSFDEGMYTCEAANALGRVRSTATLRVAASPIIVPWLGQVTSVLGRLVVLRCRAVGVLPISYTWSKGDQHTPITASQGRDVDDDGTLRIISVQWSDEGQYQCTAENQAGRQQRRTVLIVTAEDGPADRDKQTRHVLSAATHKEVQQMTPPSSKSNGVEQNSETTHQPPQQGETTVFSVQASLVDSATLVTQRFTLGNTLDFTSPLEVIGLRGRHPQIRSDHPVASEPTRPIVTQIQPPAELHQPPDLLAQSLVSNHLPWIPNPRPLLTPTPHSVTRVQSLLRIGPLNTHRAPLAAGFQLHVLESTQASSSVTGVGQSWASSPSVGPPGQPPDLSNQSTSLLPDPTRLSTKSLSEVPPLDPALQPTVPPLEPGLQPTVPPLDPALQPTVPPLEPGLQPTVPPLDPALQPTVPPLDPALQPTVPPLEPGLQPTVPPLEPGLQPTVPPLEPGLQPTVPPLEPGLQPSAPPLDPALQPTVPPLEPGLQPTVPPLDPGLQPTVPPLDPGLQPTVPPLDPGLQPTVPPLDPGLQPSIPPLDPALQPTLPPLDPALQPTLPPLDPGLQPSAPLLDPGPQPSAPPLDPGLQPSDHNLFSASQSVFEVAPTQPLALPSHSQPSMTQSQPQPSMTQSQPQPSSTQSQPQPSTTMSQPQPSMTQSQPQPSSTQSQPQPSTTQSQPQPSMTQSQPQPSTTQSQPQPSTTQSQPQPSTTQSQPQPSSTQSQPQPSSTQSQPQPSTTQSQPQPSTTQSQPQPSTTQSQPQPSTTMSQPQPSSTQSQPQPSTTMSQPQPSTTQSQPQPSSTQSQPQPSSTQSQPQPSTTQSQPQPSTTQSQPQPSTTMSQPQPSSTQSQPQPSTTQSQPQPSMTQSQPQPSSTQSQPQSSTTQSQPQSSTTQSQPQPSTTQSQPQSSTTQSQPQSSTTQSQPQPSTTQSQPQPSTTQSQPQPSMTQSQPQPSSTQSQPQPSTTQSQPQPSTTQSQPQPSTTQSQPQPSSTQSQPQPSTTQSQPQPSTTQSQPQPSTTQSQPQPSTTQSQPQPSTTMSQPQPSKPFPHPPSAQPQPAQPQGSQNVTKPPSPQPHPSQSSHGQTWQPRLRTTPTHPLSEASILTPSPPPALPLTPEPQSPDIQVPSSPPVTTVDPLRQNASQSANPAPPARSAGPNHSEPTERLKRNTSQSTMRTSEDPRVTPKPASWLPVLEKHDIPIVVGVGVSLAFIFITMAFYSLVPKNEPAPIGRGVQRNLAVPCRHAERLSAGKTYENRAFEDNELMAVIEQSPNTSDTRARPSSCSVLAQAEPSSEGLLEGPPAQPAPERSVIADTSLEPTHNSLVDTCLDEEKGCTFSHPSIQLQSVEDWMAGGGAEYPSFPDALPPPSPSLYRSPSPSPPSLREDGFRSSLTLRTAEPSAAPVRHSLSISPGNMPLLLSHCVSLGLTTVAVDVHFFPAASAATGGQPSAAAPATATPQGSQLGSRLAHSQEHDLTISGMRQSK